MQLIICAGTFIPAGTDLALIGAAFEWDTAMIRTVISDFIDLFRFKTLYFDAAFIHMNVAAN